MPAEATEAVQRDGPFPVAFTREWIKFPFGGRPKVEGGCRIIEDVLQATDVSEGADPKGDS